MPLQQAVVSVHHQVEYKALIIAYTPHLHHFLIQMLLEFRYYLKAIFYQMKESYYELV